jgi:hypothetical protein
VFGPGQAINKDRRRIYHDNGWNRYSESVDQSNQESSVKLFAVILNYRTAEMTLGAASALARALEHIPDLRQR